MSTDEPPSHNPQQAPAPPDTPPVPRAFEEHFTVEPNYDGWRLDRYLTEKLKRATRSKVTRIIRDGVRVNDRSITKAGHRIHTHDAVTLLRHERVTSLEPLPQPTVIEQHSPWLFINKPAGVLVHRTAHEVHDTVESWLAQLAPNERIEPLHRLDRDTSGILACARGPDAICQGRQHFADAQSVQKHYAAIVEDPETKWQLGNHRTLDTPLGPAGSKVRIRMGPGTLPCATHARCVAQLPGRALLDIQLQGGRQHQIRCHLALHGTPIVADKLYAHGDDFFIAWQEESTNPALLAKLALPHHALHARSLLFFGFLGRAPLPAAWRSILPAELIPTDWR